MTAPGVLVVAGEPSGDRIAAAAAAVLAARGARCFGVGGPACAAAGVELLADAAGLASMGFGDVVSRAPAIAAAIARIAGAVRRSPPRAALLVSFTELNALLGRRLRARGVRVLWCVAPQVWAWRPGRLRRLGPAVDRMAVILPFEEALWREAGVDARYVGHPSADAVAAAPPARATRLELGLPGGARALAVLPGSRGGEIARLAPALCAAAAALRRGGEVDEVRLLLAAGLAPAAAAIARDHAGRAGIQVVEGGAAGGAAPRLAAFDLALCASGTASLEAALAGAAPVVTYRMGRVAFAIARRLVRVRHAALPNILLGRRAFPELLQGEVTPDRIEAAARDLLRAEVATGRATSVAAELRAILAPPSPRPFGERVADLMTGWLEE